MSGFESFSWNLHVSFFCWVRRFTFTAAICPERIPYKEARSAEGLRNRPNPPKLPLRPQLGLRTGISAESPGYTVRGPFHGSLVAHSPAGMGWGWVGWRWEGTNSGAKERGWEGQREAGLGQAGPGTCSPPGPNPGTPGPWLPAAGDHAPTRPLPQTHTYWKTFSGLSMARGREPAAAPPALPARSSRQFESPAQPQSPRRAFARRLTIGLGCRWAGQSPGLLPGDQAPPPSRAPASPFTSRSHVEPKARGVLSVGWDSGCGVVRAS